MRQFRLLAGAAAIAAVSITTAAAQGKSGNTPKGGPTKVSSPAHGKAGGNKAGGPKNDGAKNDGASKDKSAKGTAPGKGPDDKPDDKPDNKPDKKPGSTATTTPASNAIAAKIAKNPQQLARVTALLPAGMTLEQASAGFRNQGQFIAALNASKNQGVSFAALQTAMTDGASLGQAVKRLRPATSTN